MAQTPKKKPAAKTAPAVNEAAPAVTETAPVAIETAPVAPIVPAPIAPAAPAPAKEKVGEMAVPALADVQKHIAAAQEQVASVAAKALTDSKDALLKLKAQAAEVGAGVETGAQALGKGLSEFNTKALAALRTNVEASFDHFKALMAAKSPQDAWTLQAEHSRKQFAALSAQAKELSESASKAASDVAQPLRQKIEAALGR